MHTPTTPFTVQVDGISESEWNALIDGFEDANIYQTWAFGAHCWDERQLSHLVVRRGGSPVAIAQLRVVRLPVIGSGVAYLRWGPACVPRGGTWDPAVWRAAVEALAQEYAVRRRLLLRVVPVEFREDASADAIQRVCAEFGFRDDHAVRRYQTFRVDLRPPLEALRSQLSSRWRRQLNIAERNALEVQVGQTDDLYRQFLTLYDEMMARKQFETEVDVREFHQVQRRLPDTQKMMTLLCLEHGRPVAGLVVATVGATAIYLLAATGDEGLNARGSYLLQWQAMQRLKALGHTWYDLGGANQDRNPGVFTFKSGMGGAPVSQIGRFALSQSRLSSVTVSGGEALAQALGRLRARAIKAKPDRETPSGE